MIFVCETLDISYIPQTTGPASTILLSSWNELKICLPKIDKIND